MIDRALTSKDTIWTRRKAGLNVLVDDRSTSGIGLHFRELRLLRRRIAACFAISYRFGTNGCAYETSRRLPVTNAITTTRSCTDRTRGAAIYRTTCASLGGGAEAASRCETIGFTPG